MNTLKLVIFLCKKCVITEKIIKGAQKVELWRFSLIFSPLKIENQANFWGKKFQYYKDIVKHIAI